MRHLLFDSGVLHTERKFKKAILDMKIGLTQSRFIPAVKQL